MSLKFQSNVAQAIFNARYRYDQDHMDGEELESYASGGLHESTTDIEALLFLHSHLDVFGPILLVNIAKRMHLGHLVESGDLSLFERFLNDIHQCTTYEVRTLKIGLK